MNRKNKFIEDSKNRRDDNQNPNINENNNFSLYNSKKENIINELKQKGYNEIQIDDILDTIMRNTINERPPLIDEKKHLNKQESHTLDSDLSSDKKFQGLIKKNKKLEYIINNNSKYKNSLIIKTENSESKNNNKIKPKINCAKIYINASSEKNREMILNSNEKNSENKNNGKIQNFKKYRNVPHITTPTNNKIQLNSKRINYLNKFCKNQNNSNRIEENKKEILKKFQFELNNNNKNQRNELYNNYNFKIIFDSKKNKDSMDNIGYLEIHNNSHCNSSREGMGPCIKSRNIYNEENKNNSSNIFSLKQKILSVNQVSFDFNEIKEEKENNEINKDVEAEENNKDNKDNKDNDIKLNEENSKDEKHKKKRNKGKYLKKNEFKKNKEKKNLQDNMSSKFINTKKIFSSIADNRKEISNKNKKTSIFMIRKQKTEEEEKLAKKNIAIFEIKQNEKKPCKNNDNNDIIKCEKNNKSKSLSKMNNIENKNGNIKQFEIDDHLKRSLSNYNHNFVNINLCKDLRNNSTFYRIRGYTNKENSCIKLRNHLHKEPENINLQIKSSFENLGINNKESEKNILYNKIIRMKTFENADSSSLNDLNKLNHIMVTSYNIKNKNSLDEEELDNISNTNNKINNNNNKKAQKYINAKTEDNLNVYFKTIKKYDNGIYEGSMLNDKREIKGIMVYSNGAKYEGQWRNDKKNGKGIFTSPHYYNCKNKVGMKYEGEFKDDKFEGYGVTNYTNGDKYEGEWKNNKQYGRGIVSYFDGSKYDGEWRDGKFEGIGIFYLKNGERYEGRFVNNKYNGYGKYYYNNGDYLEGIFKNDHPRGNCILHKSDGTTVNVQH